MAAMIAVAWGTSRIVFLLCGPFAFKVPRLRRLRTGFRANREEARVWREGWQQRYPELCPVVASMLFGAIWVMPAVRILTTAEYDAAREREALPEHHPSERPDPQLYEDKVGEWGLLDGRYVVVDYAMRIYLKPHEIDHRVRSVKDVIP